MRKDAEYYVSVYVDGLRQNAHNSDIAAMSRSIAGLMVDFRGEIPHGSGYHSDTVGWRVDRMRTLAADYAVAADLISALTRKQATAVCQYVALIHRHPADSDKRLCTRDAVARYVGADPHAWSVLVSRAIDKINSFLVCDQPSK